MYRQFNSEKLLGQYEVETGSVKTELIAYEKIKDIIRQFDGKMFNVKLGNALDEAVDNCSIYLKRNEHNTENGMITIFCDKRYITRNGKQYNSNTYLTSVIANLKLDGEKFNRVNSADWIEKINIKIEELNNTLKQMLKNSKVEIMEDLATKRLKLMNDIDCFNSCLDNINEDNFGIRLRY